MCFANAGRRLWYKCHQLENVCGFHSSSYVLAKISKVQHLTDNSWCEKVSNAIARNDNSVQDGVVLAANTGHLLLSHLSNTGCEQIYAWEPSLASDKSLRKTKAYKVLHTTESFFTQRRLVIGLLPFKNQNGDTIKNLFDILPKTDWLNSAAVKVIGMLPQIQSSFYAASLLTSVSQKSGLFSVGRVPHYLIVDGMEKELMCNANRHARCTRHPFYHLLFDTSLLLEIPIEAFSEKSKKGWKRKDWDRDHMFLVRLVPKANVYETVCASHHMAAFINFSKLIYRCQTHRLIPLLESYLLDCGLVLLHSGYTMLTTCGDVPFEQYPKIFKLLCSLPNYSTSGLKVLVEKTRTESIDDLP